MVCLTFVFLHLKLPPSPSFPFRAEGEFMYKFDMTALQTYLNKMKEKNASKMYYNVQVLKYDVSWTLVLVCLGVATIRIGSFFLPFFSFPFFSFL